MSDPISRQTSPRVLPISASPNRPSPLSRPHWPYSTYTHRSSSSSLHSPHSSASSIPALLDTRGAASGSGTVTPSPSSIAVRRTPNTSGSSVTPAYDNMNTRHWNFNALEWVVRDVQKLKEYTEELHAHDSEAHSSGLSTDDFEILRESPMLGDGKFKLEIAKPTTPDAPDTVTPLIRTPSTTLSLYITSVMLEYAHTDYEIYASMFAGIKCQDDRAGERGARPEWVWEFWQNDWIFREDSEVWECPLPPLTALLENPRIKETNSFVICVQIHSPVGPFFPQQPSAAYVPKDLLDGLEALLDNANTGDVQFVCLERREDNHMESAPNSPGTETPHSRRSSSSSTSSAPVSRSVARKRVIFAHSDILTRRSDYFATMLSSAFAENASPKAPGERKTYTIVVEEVDFVTVYWLLKWVYGNWLLFKEHDNPKTAIEGVGAGWSAKSIQFSADGSDEWAWKSFSKAGMHDLGQDNSGVSDARSVASADSAGNATTTAKGPSGQSRNASNRAAPRSPTTSKSSRPPPSPTRRTTAGPPSTAPGQTLAVPMSGGSSSSSSPSPARSAKSVPMPPPLSTAASSPSFPSSPHYPMSPHQRQRTKASSTDPHPHPTPSPQPASALAMYQVAHRYGMPGLASLSLEHMMSTITPQSSFALLLASSIWEELHALVEDYVVDKWDEVSVSSEFEQCCQEVAAGEWGPEGGKTLTTLFRRLRSPNALGFNRA